jgi:hypothetical protein
MPDAIRNAVPNASRNLWRDCSRISDEIRLRPRHSSFERTFVLAEGALTLSTSDSSLATRFDDVYGDCAGGVIATARLDCRVIAHETLPFIGAFFGEPLADVAAFVAYIFPERGYTSIDGDDGWTHLLRDDVPFAAIGADGTLLMMRDDGWQSFAGNVAVNLLLRKQSHLLFFHAAVCDVGGRGVMISGAKAGGKTTTSLTLAARGHALLGDEVAAIRRSDWHALPYRRAVSVRDGTRSARVSAALAGAPSPTEIFPDGKPRLRVRISELFPEKAAPVPLRAAFFLRGFAAHPQVEPVARAASSLRLLQPLGCTLWNNGSTGPTIDLLNFFEKTRCYLLDLGAPDGTAAAIERTLEDL